MCRRPRWRRLVEAVPDDVMVVIDEAYIEFVTAADREGSLDIQKDHDNVVVLRTFSKIYGLCGLRTGYGLCAPEVKQAVDKVRQPFNVNLLGQLAAVEALKHQDQVAARREENARLRQLLVDRLAERGRATVPSQSNFMLVDINDLCRPQHEVCGALLSMGAIVRDGNALGCPGWARVTVGTEDEIEFFLDKLSALERTAGEDCAPWSMMVIMRESATGDEVAHVRARVEGSARARTSPSARMSPSSPSSATARTSPSSRSRRCPAWTGWSRPSARTSS